MRFALYADAMPSGEVALSSRQAATGGFLNLSAGSLSVDARLLTGASMPQVPQVPSDMLGVDPGVFGQAVATAASFASRDKSNPVLGGVRLRERDGRLGIEATDRYRAYVRTLDVAVPEGLDVIAPAEWLRTAGAKATTFGATDRAMFVSGDGTLDMTPLIDGAYPDLGRAFSPERLRSDSVAKVERAALVKAARTMRRLVDDKPVMETRFGSDGVTMTLRGADQDVVNGCPPRCPPTRRAGSTSTTCSTRWPRSAPTTSRSGRAACSDSSTSPTRRRSSWPPSSAATRSEGRTWRDS